MARTIADLMAETLSVAGVQRIYGVVGDSLNGFTDSLRRQKKIVLDTAKEVLGDNPSGVEFLVGTMIEVPRGALTADEIAKLSVTLRAVEELHEFNPMLGHRGCRLGITYPDLTRMQARAIFEAAAQVAKKGTPVKPEVMIPLVGHVEELRRQKKIVLDTAKEVLGDNPSGVEFLVGTMIEVPRGALTADEIAKEADFFSFGTNDLTQMGFGLSRDDAGKFLGYYQEHGILEKDPFVSLDAGGIGQLVDIGVKKGSQLLGVSQQVASSKTSVTVDLAPGTYTFLCTVPGHAQAGMQGTLTVK